MQILLYYFLSLVYFCLAFYPVLKYSKTCFKRPLKKDKTKVLIANGSLMKVKSIADATIGAFCNTFDLH